MTLETGGYKLASTITLVLQANRLTKCASHPKVQILQILVQILKNYSTNISTNIEKFSTYLEND